MRKGKDLLSAVVVAFIPLLLLIALSVTWAYCELDGYDVVYYLRDGTCTCLTATGPSGSWDLTTAFFFLIISIIASLMAAMELIGRRLEPPVSTFLPAVLMVSLLLVVIFAAIGIGDMEIYPKDFSFGAGFYLTLVALILSVIYFIQPLFEGRSLFDR
jgi:hypothetical protein